MNILRLLINLGGGGCKGGRLIYYSAKYGCMVRNIHRKKRKLKPETICRLQKLFPNLKLHRIRFSVNCSLPANWFRSSNHTYGMTFGNRMYFRNSGYQREPRKIKKLVHELVHSDQVRRLGSEYSFACQYGIGFVAAGNYRNNIWEREAKDFVNANPIPPPCVIDPISLRWVPADEL